MRGAIRQDSPSNGCVGKVALLVENAKFIEVLDWILSDAYGMRAEYFDSLDAFHARDYTSLVLDAGWQRDRRGTLEGFFLLRELLMGPEAFDGPVALIAAERELFGDPDAFLPPEEGVQYFPIPLDVDAFLAFITCGERCASRRLVRMLLRGHLTAADIESIAGGDEHPLGQFNTLATDVECALDGEHSAFAVQSAGVLKGRFYSARASAARCMLASLREIVGRHEDMPEAKAELGVASEALDALSKIAKFVDEQTGNEAVPDDRWDEFVSQLKALMSFPVREMVQKWLDAWLHACRLIAERREKSPRI